ncbi:hypothetical protein [Ramlibacter montanisoli]|uniref:Uncharacterized protein n=1 Tax=Ramlibacter montanisoli TaxID=2732512 RepID=A0A849KA91_9BURK|nr:hypothetical protein [Ramlibacter montanisoli]NNU43334.1 hypothetical protein [Ramlibacter montanisoli]
MLKQNALVLEFGRRLTCTRVVPPARTRGAPPCTRNSTAAVVATTVMLEPAQLFW